MRLYMAVTNDKYELPCAITDTVAKMAAIYGIDAPNLFRMLRYDKPYRKKGVRFVRVEV